MNKYKTVGIINFFFGVPILLLSLNFSIFVTSKMSQLYQEFNSPNLSGYITKSYLVTLALFIIAIINIFLGIKNISQKQNKEKYFKYGLIVAIITFLIVGSLVGAMVISVILPIYSLSSQF